MEHNTICEDIYYNLNHENHLTEQSASEKYLNSLQEKTKNKDHVFFIVCIKEIESIFSSFNLNHIFM